MTDSALMNCPACQKEVSKKANSCPSCGEVLRKPKRGIGGKIIHFLFWAYNVLMIYAIIAGIVNTGEKSAALSGAEATGAALGTGLGIFFLLIIWLVGAVILGIMTLVTRPK